MFCRLLVKKNDFETRVNLLSTSISLISIPVSLNFNVSGDNREN